MPEQSFANHVHHPRLAVVAAFFTVLALILAGGSALLDWPLLPAVLSLALAVLLLVAISRTYIVRLQDRIILLEMKVRSAELLPPGKDALLAQLTPKQIVALRFASDEELGELLERAVRDNLPPRAIKQAVKRWRPDLLRT